MKLAIGLIFSVACAISIVVAEIDERITNGQVAQRGQFPYQVGIELSIGTRNSFCGGTLISPRWILTAGHCTRLARNVTVVLGAHKIKDPNEPGQLRIPIKRSAIKTYPKYIPMTIWNDIGLIELPYDVELNEYIQPVSLPKRGSNYSSYDGATVYASGWGKDSDSATTVSPQLNFIESKVLSRKRCNLYFFFTYITPRMICMSGKEGRSVCNGDSGGPMVIKENGKNILIGSVSFGMSLGCEKGWPGVFTRTTSYLDWVHSTTGIEG